MISALEFQRQRHGSGASRFRPGNCDPAGLKHGDQFIYVFDFEDDWCHLCSVGESAIDPVESLGIVPDNPLPYFGWGAIPDQYGRAWSADDGETQPPSDPELTDLPPLRPDWGPRGQGRNRGLC